MNIKTYSLCVLIALLSGCAGNPVKDVGNGFFTTVAYGDGGASGYADDKAMKIAANFCATKENVPNVTKQFYESPNLIRITFSCVSLNERKRIEQEKIQADKNRKLEIAKEFPFEAVLSCHYQGNLPRSIVMCLQDKQGRIDFSVRNGGSFSRYQFFYEMSDLVQGNEAHIFLKKNYTITAYNSSPNDLLVLKIKDTVTGDVIDTKVAEVSNSVIAASPR